MIRSLLIAWQIAKDTDRWPWWLCCIITLALCMPINYVLWDMARSLL